MTAMDKLKDLRALNEAALADMQAALEVKKASVEQFNAACLFLVNALEDLGRIGIVHEVVVKDSIVTVSFPLPVVRGVPDVEFKRHVPTSIAGDAIKSVADAGSAVVKVQSSEPAKKPRGGAKAMKAGPRDYQVGPFTDDEIAVIAKEVDAGKTRDEIADLVNRSKISVGMKIKALKKERAKKPRPVSAAPVPAKLAAKAMPKAAPVAKPVPVSADDQAVISHLDQLGYSGDWSADKDFEVLSGLISGKAAALLADQLGVEVGDVVARFKALNKKVGDIGHQSRLLRILRQRSGA